MEPLRNTVITLAAFTAANISFAGSAEDISSRIETFEAAFNSGDAAAVAQHYSEEAVLLAPDTPRIDGREDIQALWQAYIDAGVKNLDLVTTDLVDLGNIANEIGTYTLSAPDGNGGTAALSGKYVIVWKRDEGGNWNLHWDIWNSTPLP